MVLIAGSNFRFTNDILNERSQEKLCRKMEEDFKNFGERFQKPFRKISKTLDEDINYTRKSSQAANLVDKRESFSS